MYDDWIGVQSKRSIVITICPDGNVKQDVSHSRSHPVPKTIPVILEAIELESDIGLGCNGQLVLLLPSALLPSSDNIYHFFRNRRHRPLATCNIKEDYKNDDN